MIITFSLVDQKIYESTCYANPTGITGNTAEVDWGISKQNTPGRNLEWLMGFNLANENMNYTSGKIKNHCNIK